MIDFINKRSELDIGYFELLETIDAGCMNPTEASFDNLKSLSGGATIHPSCAWEKPDASDCNWPGNGTMEGEVKGVIDSHVPGRLFWIRHDVDNHINLSWDMALEEYNRGIKAVYFFLNTAPYFRWAAFLDMARDFVKIGHVIGLHNNTVAMAYKFGSADLAEETMKRDLGYLRVAGDIFITASHGDIWNRHHNVLNYEMFTECKRRGVFPHKPMAHYGLKYEAYHTPYTFYLADSGGKWAGFDDEKERQTDPAKLIKKFNETDSGIMQLLVHPEWWEAR
jgi:hypothetical protein